MTQEESDRHEADRQKVADQHTRSERTLERVKRALRTADEALAFHAKVDAILDDYDRADQDRLARRDP